MRLVRFHELLRQCLAMCDESRALVELPPVASAAAEDAGGSSETTRQYFLSQFGSVRPPASGVNNSDPFPSDTRLGRC